MIDYNNPKLCNSLDWHIWNRSQLDVVNDINTLQLLFDDLKWHTEKWCLFNRGRKCAAFVEIQKQLSISNRKLALVEHSSFSRKKFPSETMNSRFGTSSEIGSKKILMLNQWQKMIEHFQFMDEFICTTIHSLI